MTSTNEYMLARSCLATVKLQGKSCRAIDGINAPECPNQCWLQMILSLWAFSGVIGMFALQTSKPIKELCALLKIIETPESVH